MLQTFFHAWERRPASLTTGRVGPPFGWGLDWVPRDGHRRDAWPPEVIGDWVSEVMRDTGAFFTPPPTEDYTLGPEADGERELTFPSALTTPHPANNTVHCRYFPTTAKQASGGR